MNKNVVFSTHREMSHIRMGVSKPVQTFDWYRGVNPTSRANC